MGTGESQLPIEHDMSAWKHHNNPNTDGIPGKYVPWYIYLD